MHTVNRHFVFLQGVASPFFRHLAEAVSDTGARISRVNFCGGDWLYSGHHDDWDFRLRHARFAAWFRLKLMQHRVTDIVLFGDFRPVHADAIRLAKARNITVHVFEEGYLRPHWITLDEGGVNANSSLPGSAAELLNTPVPAFLPEAKDAGYRLRVRALHDFSYHAASFLMRWRYPYYRTHRNRTPAHEYWGWVKRFPTLPFHARRCRKIINELIESGDSFYVHPLQLSADTQIKIHSPYEDVHHALREIMHSFAVDAPAGSKLVIKNHPLDTGLDGHRNFIRELAAELGLEGRVVYLETGNLDKLIKHARGTVVINSTVGMAALKLRCPLVALGKAIYNFKGLSWQGSLAQFWTQATPCDAELFQQFCKVVIHQTQLNGDLYGNKGIAMATRACLPRFKLTALNLPAKQAGHYSPGLSSTPRALLSEKHQ